MEKKLRHKKTGEISYYKDGILKSGQCCVEIGREPSSEIWEEVIDKDYEILSLHPNTNYIGEYQILTDKENIDSWVHPITRGNWEIHSIKRIIDGEIFSIGDRINYKEDDIPSGVTIQEFQIHNNKIFINSHYNAAHLLNRELSNWKKSKPKPLFTTKDGYEIFLGDKCYYLDDNFTLYSTLKTIHTSGSADFIYFKEKTNAEEWILLNKPCLSIKDVLSVGERVIVDEGKLKQLVKSKL